MISHHSHFQPGCQIIKEAETGTSHGKYILQKALLSVAGPEIQVIHIKALDLDSPVDPHSQPEKQSHKDQMILPLIFFLHSGKSDPEFYSVLCFQCFCLLYSGVFAGRLPESVLSHTVVLAEALRLLCLKLLCFFI